MGGGKPSPGVIAAASRGLLMARDLKAMSNAARAAAIDIARGHERLGPILEAGAHITFAEPNLHDARRNPDGVVLGIYEPQTRRSFVVLVEPAAGTVTGVEETPAQFQLNADEAKSAEALAAKDNRVKAFLGGRAMKPLTRLYFPPAHTVPAHENRHAIVFVRPSNSERRYAIVDLTSRTVVDVLDALNT
jgi:hypothetical protein